MPNKNNGFNDDSVIAFGSSIDLSGFEKDLKTLEKSVTNAKKNKAIDIGIADSSIKEIEELKSQIEELQKTITKVDKTKISASTFYQKKKELENKIDAIEKRVDILQQTLGDTISLLDKMGKGADFSGIIDNFKKSTQAAKETLDVIEEVANVTKGTGGKITINTSEIAELEDALTRLKKVQAFYEKQSDVSYDNLGIEKLVTQYNLLSKSYQQAYKELKKYYAIRQGVYDNPDSTSNQKMIADMDLRGATLKVSALAQSLDIVKTDIQQIQEKSGNKLIDFDNGNMAKFVSNVEQAVKEFSKSDEEAKELQGTIERIIQENIELAKQDGIDKPLEEATEDAKVLVDNLEKVEKQYDELGARASSTSKLVSKATEQVNAQISLRELLENKAIDITVTTNTGELEENLLKKIKDIQDTLNNESLVVPVKIVIKNERENAKNPLSTSKADIKRARNEAEEVVVDLATLTDKSMKRVLNAAQQNVTNFVKQIKDKLKSIFTDQVYYVDAKISETSLDEIKREFQANVLINKQTLASDIEYANEAAKELAQNIKEVLGLIAAEKGAQSSLSSVNYGKSKGKKKSETEELIGSLEEYKKQAQEVKEKIQKTIFDKKPVYMRLDIKDANLNALHKKVDNEDFGQSLRESLLKAEATADGIVEVLSKLDGLDIKIGSGGKAGANNIEAIRTDLNGIFIGLSQILEEIKKVESAISGTKQNKTHESLQIVSTDFTEITNKIEELISTTKTLVNSLRSDISRIDDSFRNLGQSIDTALNEKTIHTITDELHGLDLSTLERSLAGVYEWLMKISNQLDGISGTIKQVDNSSLESQWKNIATRFHEIADYSDSIDLRKTKKQAEEMIKLFAQYKNMGGLNSFNMLTDNTETLEKLQKLASKAIGSNFSILDNSRLTETKEQLQVLDTLLSSITGSLSHINDLQNVSKVFSALSINDNTLAKIQRLPNELNLIAEKLRELDNLPYSGFIEQLSLITERGESLKSIAEILKHSQKQIEASISIADGNKENKKQLEKETKLLEKYQKQYNDELEKANKHGTDYAKVLREIETALVGVSKFQDLDIVSTDDITQAKDLNSQLETMFKNLKTISSEEKNYQDELKKSLKQYTNNAKRYERNYYSSWGYGKHAKLFGGEDSDYANTLRQIVVKTEELKALGEIKTVTEENVKNAKKLDEEITELFEHLVSINRLATETQVTNLQNKIAQYFQKNNRLTIGMQNQLISLFERLNAGADLTDAELKKIAADFNRIQYSAKAAGLEGAGFLDAIKNKLKYGWAQSIAMFFSFYDIIRYVREISSTVTELNSNLIELAKVSDTSIVELYRGFDDFNDIAKETGGTINDIIKSTADWARNGYNLPDSKELARLSSIFQNIGDGLSESQANEYLVSILKGFNLEASQAIEIMDKINNVSNNAASSVANIGEALERSSSSFGAAKTNLSEAIALLTSANEILQSPEVVGTAFKSMSARLRSSTTELEEMGEEATLTTSKLRALVQSLTGVDIQRDENTFKSIYDILLEIGNEWQNLTDVEQASLSEALFGKRNSQVGFAILNNVERLQEIYALAENSAGSAMEEQSKYLQGVQYQIDVFKASVENLANDFMTSDFLKNTIKVGTNFINILDSIIDKLGSIPALVGAISAAVGSKHNILFGFFSSLMSNKKTLPLTANSDIGALAAANNSKSIKMLIDEYNSSFSNLDRITKNTQLNHTAFINEVAKGNSVLAAYLNSLGRDSAASYGSYRREQIKTLATTTALRIGTMLLQGVLFAAASVVASKVIQAISDLIHANEKAIETGEKAKQTVNSVKNALETQQKTIKESAKRFAELSQGVDQITGKNISLSDEDYQEFLSISNKLAEVFPTLTRSYDENGNAIIDLDGDVNTITKSLYSLLEVEERLANQKYLDSFNDIWKGLRAKSSEFDGSLYETRKGINDLERQINASNKNLEEGLVLNNDFTEDVKALLEAYGVELRKGTAGWYFDAKLLTEEIKQKAIDIYQADLNDLNQKLIQTQNDAAEVFSEANPYIDIWLDKQFAKNPNKYSSKIQTGIKQLISNALISPTDNFLKQAESDADLYNIITNQILEAFENDEDFSIKYEVALDAITAFNNNEISAGQFEEYIRELLPYLQKYPNLKKTILISLGLDLSENGTDIINPLVNNVRNQMEDAGIDKAIAEKIADGLNSNELKYLYNNAFDWTKILNIENATEAIKTLKSDLLHLSSTPFKIEYDKNTIKNTTNGIKSIQSAYQSLYDSIQEGKVGEELAFSYEELDDLKGKLVDVNGYAVNLGDTWTNFYNIMSDGNHTFEEMRDALNEVLTAYVNATIGLNNFDAAEAKALSTQLQRAGVTKESADTYVQAYVDRAEAVQYATKMGYDFIDQIDSEDVAFINEAEAAGYSKEQLAFYALEKQIANGLVISTAADCENLIQLASIAGATNEQLAKLIELKARLANVQAMIDAHPDTAAATALVNEANKIREEIEDYLVEDVVADAKARAANFKFSDKKSNSSKSGGGGGSKSEKEEDLWKKAYEEELAALDHLHEMELISDIQYYEERERLNDKYFKDNEKYAEEYNKNLEEIYKGFQSAYKQYVDDMSDYWKKSLEANLIDFKTYCSQMETMLNSLHDAGKINDETYYTELGEYYSYVIENYDKAINAVQRTIKKRIDALNDEKEALEKDYQNRKDLIQSQIDGINEQIDATQKEIDKLEEANKERQSALDMQKALYELNRAENQRPDYVYNSEKGFIYQNRGADIKAAQDELDNLRYEQQVSILEKTITTLNEQIDGLNKQIDDLDEELDRLTDAIDSQIDKLQEYSDKWGEVKNKYQEAQEDIIATAIWGSDWQNDILAMDEQILANFTDNYMDMQQKQSDAAVNAANAKIAAYNAEIQALNALKEAQESAQKTSTSSAVAKSTNVSTGKAKTTVPPKENKNKSPSNSSTIHYAYARGSKVYYEKYGSGTNHALPGYHEIAESGDEIVLDNYGNAYLAKGKQLHRFEGGEKVYDENDTRELLRGKYLPIDSLFPNYSDMLSKISNIQMSFNGIGNSVVSKKPSLGGNTEITNSFTVTIGDINVSEVNDASALAKAITNKLPNALLQELNRK